MKIKIPEIKSHDAMLSIFLFVVSIFYIWLIENPLKYFYLPLIIGAFIVIRKILMIDNKNSGDISFTSSQRKLPLFEKEKNKFYFLFNYGFVVICLFLVVQNIFNFLFFEFIRGILTLSIILLLPGFVVFENKKNLRESFSNLEFLLFILIFNYIFAGIFWLFLLLMDINQKSLVFMSFYLILSIINLILKSSSKLKLRKAEFKIPKSFSTRKDKYGILIILLFFTFSHILTLPAISYSYIDIQRHYAYAVLLGRDLDLYLNVNWGNFLAHLFESAFIYSARSNMEIIQVCLVFITYFYPLFFYVFVKRFFNQKDSRLPIFATMIYMLGSLGGIGWIYYVKTKIEIILGQSLMYNNLINTVFYQTFKSNSYGFIPSYFKPIMVSMFVFFFLLQLLRNFKLSQKNFLLIFSLFLTAMYFIHVVEATIFAFFLGCWGLFYRSEQYRINSSLFASMISTFLAILGFTGLNLLKHKIPTIYFAILGLNLFIIVISIIFRIKWLPRLLKKSSENQNDFLILNSETQRKIIYLFPIIGLIFLITAILTWITLWDSYDISFFILNPYRQIPWFFQGLRLGFLGLCGFYYLYLRNLKANSKKSVMIREFNFVLVFSIYSFLIGRLITFINIFLFPESPVYWETRFETFIIIPFVILTPLLFLSIFDKYCQNFKLSNLKSSFIHIKHNFKGYSLVLLVFFSNFTIVLLNLEVRWAISVPYRIIKLDDNWHDIYEGIDNLSDLLDQNPSTAILTISMKTFEKVNTVGPANLVLLPETISETPNPTPFLQEVHKAHYWRNIFSYENVYLYLSSDDLKYLEKAYLSFLGSFIKLVPKIFENSEVAIYDISHISFPALNSKTSLIYPIDDIFENESKSNLITSLISQGNVNISLASDGEFLDDYSNLILSYDIPNKSEVGVLDFRKFEKKGVWIINWTNLIEINGNYDIQRVSNITFPQELAKFNLTFNINWTNFTNSTQSQMKFLFKRDLKQVYSEIVFNYTTQGEIFCYFHDEFTDNKSNFSNYNVLKSNISSIFSFTAQFIDGIFNFYLNDEKFFNISGIYPTTVIGFQYLNSIGDNHLSINITNNFCTKYYPNLQSKDIYYQYVEDGKNLIIFNSNGYYNFASDFYEINSSFDTELNKIEINQIQFNSSEFSINSLFVEFLQAKDDNISILANYSNSDQSVPFILKKNLGAGQLIYINIYPLISSSSLNYTVSLFFNELFWEEFLKLINIDQFNASLAYEYLEQSIPIDQVFLLESTITAENIIIPADDACNIEKIKVFFKNNTEKIIPDIYQFRIMKSGNITLQQSQAILSVEETKKGFTYPQLIQNNTFQIYFSSDNEENNEIEIKCANSTNIIQNISHISFYLLEDLSILLKNARVNASKIEIKYLIEPLFFKNYYSAYTNNILKFSSSSPFGLSFSISTNGESLVIFQPNFEIDQPVNRDFYYNELKSIPIAVFWLVIEFFIYIIYNKVKRKKIKTKIEKGEIKNNF
ncbi:MAG: hypothetical protein K9W44_15030 [Candidatus Lokiarchaeota archaeon]|nr:hypothetical protein [Candidatus Harpocratesius repetitus]